MVSLKKKPKRARKPLQKSELDRRLLTSFTSLDESNVKAGIIMAVGDNKIADCTVDKNTAPKLNHPQGESCSVPDPTDIDSFSISEFLVHRALMSFPNGFSAGLDVISPQVFKSFERKVLFELRPYLFGAKLVALKQAEGELRPITVGNTFCHLSKKCAGYHVFESRHARYGSRQVGVGTKKRAESCFA